MNAAAPPERAAFSRGMAAALIAGGFAMFIALLFLIGQGESVTESRQNGAAHAGANGLNGYSGLTRLAQAAGYRVSRSRSASALEGYHLLVLTPPPGADANQLGRLLQKRRRIGPTLVILPKWYASLPPGNLPAEARKEFKPGWVTLGRAGTASWPARLPAPLTFSHKGKQLESGAAARWQGLGRSGQLPTGSIAYAADNPAHKRLITDASGNGLAVLVQTYPDGDYAGEYAPLIFVAEPDLVNNYGLADPARAAAAMRLIDELDDNGRGRIVFDLTLNGFGGSENLLSLAFRPPFLAATLCLIMALAIIFWRAMMRFGPAAVRAPATAFGKQQLVTNAAGLILRARRWRLLGPPYAALAGRRLARTLGLTRHDGSAIDAALAIRAPDEEPFTARAARLEQATKPADILSAAAALDTLNRKLKS